MSAPNAWLYQTTEDRMTDRRRITEAEAEQMADRIVQRRLATDSAYLNAEDANAQSSREERISMDVWADLEAKYEIA